MNDDRLLGALRQYGDLRVSRSADRAVRARLDEGWSGARVSRAPWAARMLPVPLALVLTLALGGGALGAGADSPLWNVRVTLEDLGAVARVTADARIAYLQDLVESRTAEMARLEAAGNAAAASKARTARERALRSLGVTSLLDPSPPPSAAPAVLPAGTPSPAPTATPTRTPSPSATATPVPAVSPVLTAAPTATPVRPTPTAAPKVEPTPTKPPPGTPTPKPTPTQPVKQPVFISGRVVFADGTNVNNACIATGQSATGCLTWSQSGSWAFVADLVPGTTVTLYATVTEAARGGNLAGFATAVLKAPMTEFGTITLKPQ